MAPAKQIQLAFACLAAAALIGVATADYTERFTFTVYAQPASVVKTVWTDATGNLEGEVAEAKGTKTADPNSEVYATLGGLEFDVIWSTKFITNSASYIKFVDIGPKGGRFADSVVYLRSQFNYNPDVTLRPVQTAAIVGGTKGLAGAYGNITYTEVAGSKGVFRVDGLFFIDY